MLYLNLAPPFQPFQPPQSQYTTTQIPQVRAWSQYRMHELLGLTHEMAATYIEYPHDWQIIPDYYKGMVTFAQDTEQTVAFTLCPQLKLHNPSQRTASEFFQLLLIEARKKVPDVQVVREEFPPFQNYAGMLVSEGIVELQGTEKGINMRYYVWVNYMYYQGYYSAGLAMFSIGQAPAPQAPDIKRYIFDRMVRSFLNSFPKTGGTGKDKNGKPGDGG